MLPLYNYSPVIPKLRPICPPIPMSPILDMGVTMIIVFYSFLQKAIYGGVGTLFWDSFVNDIVVLLE